MASEPYRYTWYLKQVMAGLPMAIHWDFLNLKGAWQWGGFSGVFAEIGSSWVPYTTFRALLSRRLSVSVIRGVADSPYRCVRGVDDSPHHWYAESATPRITDTESRLLNFLKRKLSVSMIRRVVDSPHQWYGESPTSLIVQSESRRLRVYHRYGESMTPRIVESGSRRLPVLVIQGVAILASIFSTLNC